MVSAAVVRQQDAAVRGRGRGVGEVVRGGGWGEALIKSISIIAMCQAVINKQGMVWTAARVDLMA